MSYTLVTAATQEPVSLRQAKDHLNYREIDQDGLITSWIRAARKYCETVTGRQFVTQTWAYKADRFPATGTILLTHSPVQSITSISYIDSDGATQTWASSLYKFDGSSEPARITPAYGESFPSTRSEIDAVTVTFVTGFGNPIAVPDTIKSAMKLLVGEFFANRGEEASEGAKKTVKDLLGVERNILVA